MNLGSAARTGASGGDPDDPDDRMAGAENAVWWALRAEFRLALARRADQPVRVLDVGGGSGVWAVPMAAAGCAVTVVDTSPAPSSCCGTTRTCPTPRSPGSSGAGR